MPLEIFSPGIFIYYNFMGIVMRELRDLSLCKGIFFY